MGRTCSKCCSPFIPRATAKTVTHVCDDCRVSHSKTHSRCAKDLAGKPITDRERHVITHLMLEESNKAIAWALGLDEGTVKVYLYRIYRKLEISGRVGLVKWAMRNGF